MNFVFHIAIMAIIFSILAVGFKFFLKLIGTLDFSYMGIVMFGAYSASLIHLHRWWWILSSVAGAFVFSLPFTIFVMYLSTKLSELYFAIGTLTVYVLMYQLAFNLEFITRWAFGLAGIGRDVIADLDIVSIQSFLLFAAIVMILLFVGLYFFKRTYFFRILQARWEGPLITKSLGIYTSKYVLSMICITTLLAVIGWSLFAFYYRYIDPPSFWIGMLTVLLTISFLSYKYNEATTFLIGFGVMFFYEYLRFFKIVDPSKLWYIREIIFTLSIVIIGFVVFRKLQFARKQ